MAQAKRRKAREPRKAAGLPKADLRTMAELVAETGLSAARIAMAARGGFIAQTVRGRYDRIPTLLGLIRYGESCRGQLPVYDNAAQCSSATGIPIATINQAKRKSSLGTSSNISLSILLGVLFSQNGENVSEGKDKYSLLREKQRYEKEAGLLIPKSDVAHDVKRGLSVLFRQLDQRSNVDLPPALKGLDAAEIQQELVKADEELKSVLMREWSALMRNGEVKNGENQSHP